MKEITQAYSDDALKKLPKKTDQLFLFLDSDYFEDSISEVKAVEPHINIELLWDNNPLWDEYKYDGPIIVQLNENSNLIAHFIEHWAKENRGVIIQSSYKAEDIFNHLQSLTFTAEPDDTLTRLRLYEPRKLRGIMDAMQENEPLESLMGPIEKFIWQENCGEESTWLTTKNPKPHPAKHDISDEHWFAFSKPQNDIIAQNEVRYFFRNLAWQLSEDFELEINDAQKQSETLTREARTMGFMRNDDMESYVRLRMQYGDFRNKQTVKKHLHNANDNPGGRLTKIKVFLEQTLGEK